MPVVYARLSLNAQVLCNEVNIQKNSKKIKAQIINGNGQISMNTEEHLLFEILDE